MRFLRNFYRYRTRDIVYIFSPPVLYAPKISFFDNIILLLFDTHIIVGVYYYMNSAADESVEFVATGNSFYSAAGVAALQIVKTVW